MGPWECFPFVLFTKLCMRSQKWDRQAVPFLGPGGPIFGTVFRFIFWSFLYQVAEAQSFGFNETLWLMATGLQLHLREVTTRLASCIAFPVKPSKAKSGWVVTYVWFWRYSWVPVHVTYNPSCSHVLSVKTCTGLVPVDALTTLGPAFCRSSNAARITPLALQVCVGYSRVGDVVVGLENFNIRRQEVALYFLPSGW